MVAHAPQFEAALLEDIASFQHDPLGFVRYAFAWGKGELEGFDGPRRWQEEILLDIGQRLRAGQSVQEAILMAVSSGHGIGKSALLSWLIIWAMSTREDTRAVVTANTGAQLATKTWPELAKWHRLAINSHWFELTATAMFSADPKHERTWRADAITWSENNTEAFAGLHNQGGRILVVFDEGSAIVDKIWEVTEGALTDANTEIIWCVFGNPTRNTGRFFECFGKYAHRWIRRQIDSRTVEGTDKKYLDGMVADHGEDSDIVRVRVRGLFPYAASMQFIPLDRIEAATRRESQCNIHDPLIMGVDIARFGTDKSVIRFRRGLDGNCIKPIKIAGQDLMTVAGRVAEAIGEHRPDAVFIDETGMGGGVVDRLRQLGHRVIGINFGRAADSQPDGLVCANKRAEMWAKMRAWLDTGAIDSDSELRAGLEACEYHYDKLNRIQLESKDDMRDKGLGSPDDADAFALTFAQPVAPVDRSGGFRMNQSRGQMRAEWNPFAEANS